MTRWWDHNERPHLKGDETSRMGLCGWAAALRGDVALEGSWCFLKPHDDAGAAIGVYAPRRSPKTQSKIQTRSFWTEMSKMELPSVWKCGGSNVISIVVWLWRRHSGSSIKGVVSMGCTWVSQTLLSPCQHKWSPELFMTLALKRRASGGQGWPGQPEVLECGILRQPQMKGNGELTRVAV